ncbi:uncharacterized protein LOC114534140 [Dendronephthya gigantea]|uniref:uncharacterized protein LOC114534140 n=1 Tax=Dendronephthya gigantea TaxID=151771 RepID=UPI00106C7985|nr:uncharacterized protein LOC114534140 [Dendronephthya gigantea]
MSSDELLTKFDDLVKRFKEEFHEIVEGERAKLKAKVEAYNAEKKRMNAVVVRDDDIINLNVGGKKFTTTRSTLCQVKDSLLASMFSGRWEDSVPRDQDGAVFFDHNPKYFGLILDYLRAKKVATPENPAPLPDVPDDQVKNFQNLVGYLGLSEEIVPAKIVLTDKFNLRSPEITLQEEGRVAVHDSNSGHKYVLGENTYQQGIVRFKLNLESFKYNNWILVGVLEAGVVPQSQSNHNNSFLWSGCNGWGLGTDSYAGVFKNGSRSKENNLQNLTKQGDNVEVILNCDESKLSLHLPTAHQFHMNIPKSKSWRLHVNLHGANEKIRIVEVVQG